MYGTRGEWERKYKERGILYSTRLVLLKWVTPIFIAILSFIALVVICVILADYIKDSEVGKEKATYKGFSVEWRDRTENKDFILVISSVDTKNKASLEDVSFTLYDQDRKDMSNGEHRVVNVYGVPIDDKNFISFRDGDHDGMLSIGDCFIIKSMEHIDDDGSTDSPGYAEAGYRFVVRVDEVKIIDVELPHYNILEYTVELESRSEGPDEVLLPINVNREFKDSLRINSGKGRFDMVGTEYGLALRVNFSGKIEIRGKLETIKGIEDRNLTMVNRSEEYQWIECWIYFNPFNVSDYNCSIDLKLEYGALDWWETYSFRDSLTEERHRLQEGWHTYYASHWAES